MNAYLSSNEMKATASSLALASSVLGFEIVELWSQEESSGKLHCIFVQVDRDFLSKYPDIISGHYPNHKKEHKISPEVI
jgi:hypothetical protein